MTLYDLSLVEAMGKKDSGFVADVLNLFLESIPVDLAQLNLSLAQKDWKELAFVAHQLKSTIDTLGVNSLSETIRLIEAANKDNNANQQTLQLNIEKVTAVLNEVVVELKVKFPASVN